jgi:hypothetical protein
MEKHMNLNITLLGLLRGIKDISHLDAEWDK